MTRRPDFFRWILSTCLAVVVLPLHAEAGAERIEATWSKTTQWLQNRSFDAERRIDDRMARLEAKLKKSWDRVDKTGVKVLVDYADDGKSRATVRFEDGKVIVEAIAETRVDALTLADTSAALTNQLLGLATNVDGNGIAFLKNQIPGKKAVEALARPERTIFTNAEGIPTAKYRVEVPLKANHLETRAAQYLPLAKSVAELYDVPVDLVMAIMETESSFNPYADNGIAFGLMQIVPGSGGLEASRTVFGKEVQLKPFELKNPELNAKMGSALLHRYAHIYLAKYADPVSRRDLLTTAAYNAGITSALRFAAKQYDTLASRSDESFLQNLIGAMPGETKHYLQVVPERRVKYQGL